MIKRFFIILSCVYVCSIVQGQINLKTEVHESELTNLRTEFNELSKRKDVPNAVEKGALLSELYVLSKNYKDASNICIQMDNLIYPHDKQTGKTSFSLRFLVAKERLRLYTQELNFQKAKAQLDQMNYCMRYIEDQSQHLDDALLVKAQYYHAFGMIEKSLDCYDDLLQHCLSEKADLDREDCYKNMIAYAEQKKDTELGLSIQKKYTIWQDSIKMVRAAEELDVLKKEHETLQADLKQKEDSISNNKIIIGSLWVFIIAMIAGLVVLFFLFMRSIYRIRKLKNNLKMANDNNAQKSAFISNVNSQITPSLDEIEKELNQSSSPYIIKEKLADLKKNIADMQTYISLEKVLNESYPVKDTDISKFCENMMQKVRPEIKEGVESVVSAPRISIKTNTEALEQILGYLLSRSAKHTKSGKIILEFKKRNARTGQFIITDTGDPIDSSLQEELFKPFGPSDPTMKGDSWGLPICNLIAYRLNGTLKIDKDYKRGTQFILDFCS